MIPAILSIAPITCSAPAGNTMLAPEIASIYFPINQTSDDCVNPLDVRLRTMECSEADLRP